MVLAALLLVPVALAQTRINPIEGAYTDVYIVTGRAIDALGNPAAQAVILVELDQPGVKAKPLRAGTDCFGVYIAGFDLRDVKPEGRVKVTLESEGVRSSAEAPLDPFFRRTQLNLRHEGQWTGSCEDQTALWKSRVSVTGRIVERTEPYEDDGVTHHAKPWNGPVQLWYWVEEGRADCPPLPSDGTRCDTNAGRTDERGDFRYSWIYENELDVEGDRIEIFVGNASYNLTVDPEYRTAVALIDTTGRGAPTYQTPTPPLGILVLAIAAVALLARRARR